MKDQIFTQPGGLPEHDSDLASAIRDIVLFADDAGTVLHAGERATERLGSAPLLGRPFWQALGLDVHSLEAALLAYPPGIAHEVGSKSDQPSVLLRIMPLPLSLAREGGFVLVLTDSAPLEEIHEEFRERIEDNIAAWDDSVTLFTALFESSSDAFLLTDEKLLVLAANPRAIGLFGSQGRAPVGADCKSFIAPGFHSIFHTAAKSAADTPWTGRIEALAENGETFPAQFTLRRVALQKNDVFQVIVEDWSLQSELKERTAEVASMNLALKKVIHTVEEEKQEFKEEMVQEVKDRVLPAVERLTESTSPEIRRGYQSVIQDQLAGLAEGTGSGEEEASLMRLTLREMEICRRVQMGRKGREIAEELDISFETMQTHRKNIRRKLDLKGRKVSLANFLANHLSIPQE